MQIKHMPSGLFPHIDCGYQRLPCYPDAGEEVVVRCRLEGILSYDEVWLQYRINDMNMSSVIGRRFNKENDDRIYYEFDLGRYEVHDHVSYQIFASVDGRTIHSDTYDFAATQKVSFSAPVRVVRTGDRIYAEYRWNDLKPVIEITVSDEIKVRLYRHLNVSEDAAVFHTYEKQTDCGYRIKIMSSPFRVQLYKGRELMGGFDETSMNFVMHVDKYNAVKKVSYSVHTNSSCFYGFGEKYDRVNQADLSPLSYVVEQYSNQQDKTYLPIPFYYTEKEFGYYRNTYDKLQFTIRSGREGKPAVITMESICPADNLLFEDTIMAGKPADMIMKYHTITGKPVLPPKWVFGPWISANGWNTQKEASEQLTYLKELSIPATVMVLEAWSDEENFYIFNDAGYSPNDGSGSFQYEDFTFAKKGKWPDPIGLVNLINENNMKLILWQIPVIKYERQEHGKQLDLDEEYAIKHRLCIMNQDGTPYRITDNWFHNSIMPDFTNPRTKEWWFKKREYLLTQLGVAGFKTDGGEFLFDDTAVFFNGKSGAEMHNEYPNLYVGAYNEFMDRYLGKNKGVTFSRAGYSGAQKYPIHWAGDQISTFSELRGQLTAGLSAGLSGVFFWSFDIGGFAGEFPTKELYLRSAALGAFVPVMQFHSEPRSGQYYLTARDHWNNDRTPWNLAEVHKDAEIISGYRRFANLRMNLVPYLYNEALYCVKNGRPMMAHLIVDNLEDDKVFNLEDEYMFGRGMLVAPVIEEGNLEREIYLPSGVWHDFFTGERYEGNQIIHYLCGLDKIPVFCKEGACLPLHVNHEFIMGTDGADSFIGNSLKEYENLCFFCFGDCSLEFMDDMDHKISIKSAGGCIRITAEGCLSHLVIVMMNGDHPAKILVNGKESEKLEYVQLKAMDRILNGIKIMPE